ERGREERFNERAPDALAAHVLAHVHGVFDRITIARPGAAPLAERGKAENLDGVDGHKHGKSLRLPRGEPRASLIKGRGVRRVDRGRSGDDLVVDREHAREVGFARRGYGRHGFAPLTLYAIASICLL